MTVWVTVLSWGDAVEFTGKSELVTGEVGFVGFIEDKEFVGLIEGKEFVGVAEEEGFVGIAEEERFSGLIGDDPAAEMVFVSEMVTVAEQDLSLLLLGYISEVLGRV